MREKELRLALICYGGISLAVYMHGVTKEVWRLAQASQAMLAGEGTKTSNIYKDLLDLIRSKGGTRLRILPDIVAGASAGGINGIFLAQAIATGQSLDPLTRLWLDNADVERLLDPDARPNSALSKFWASPLAWAALRGRDDGDTVSDKTAEQEIRGKLSQFIRSRWFEPPFGGPGFSAMLLDAFDAMAAGEIGPRLLPAGHPLDLFVTVTDFHGHSTRLKLNSPINANENEHRLVITFRDSGDGKGLGDSAGLTLAARATASFPGAFPPFNVTELDGVLKSRSRPWPDRGRFLATALAGCPNPETVALIDGSVLANAPFRPAIAALPNRPARREVDRRFVYIDPKPGRRAVRIGRKGESATPGFLSTIFGAMSDIPREQPIRDSLEAIEERSVRIRRMQRIIESVYPGVEVAIEKLFGRTFFLDRPTSDRLDAWRSKAQSGATREAGFAYASYAHMKLSGIVEELANSAARQEPALKGSAFDDFRQAIWAEVRARGADKAWVPKKQAASDETIAFFRAHDLGFRIRRIRFLLRRVAKLITSHELDAKVIDPLRAALFSLLSAYLDRQSIDFLQPLDRSNIGALLDDIARQRSLSALDRETDAALAEAFGALPKDERRAVLMAYLGFPYFDISTLPMAHGEELDEFDPIKVDRISPDDALAIRSGGVAATLKGIEFNSFGAFFSRLYRENDYLWGRLHGADRLFDIVLSAVPDAESLPQAEARTLKRNLLLSIIDEEQLKLTKIRGLCAELRREIAAGPLAD